MKMTEVNHNPLPAITVLKRDDALVQEQEWGRLLWFAGGNLRNSAALTVGCCEIKPGYANSRHQHPNCEEVLHVLQGTIAHTGVNGDEILQPGDTISVPPRTLHQARNIGQDLAILSISFSSADRRTQGK